MKNAQKWAVMTVGAAILLTPLLLCAQGEKTPALEFEVASIKLNTSGAGIIGIAPSPGGRLNVTNATLRQLIRFAFNVDDSQISAGPAWMDSEHYDIVAKGNGNATTNELRQMLQKLLADRFGMKIHHDSKELPVYNLVVAKGGPKLKESEIQVPAPGARGDGGGQRGAGVRIAIGGTTQIAGTMSLAQLSLTLANLVGRKVIDKTGLQGNYDVKIEWTAQPGELQGLRGLPPAGGGDRGAPAAEDPNAVSIFTAIQEQLGLRLDSQRGPVDIIVIDSAAKPTEN